MIQTTQIAIEKNYDTLELIERRFRLLIGAKWEDKTEVLKAITAQDKLRKRLDKKLAGKNGTQIIREWRDKRCRY